MIDRHKLRELGIFVVAVVLFVAYIIVVGLMWHGAL